MRSTAYHQCKQQLMEPAPHEPPRPDGLYPRAPKCRWFSSSFCLGADYAGSVIGEDQWEWLGGQLENSDASVHVLVSTLQVTYAVICGWTAICAG